MNDAELLNRLRTINPIPRRPDLDPRELQLLDERIEPGGWIMTTTATREERAVPPPAPRRRWRPGTVVAVAMLAALLAVGIPVLLLLARGDDSEPSDEIIPDSPTTIESHLGIDCNSVAVGSDGTVWVVGTATLSRFDGSSWDEIPPPPGRALPECGGTAAAMEGGVWIATAEGALRYADGSWASFTNPYDLVPDWCEGPCGFADIAISPDGNVYATGEGSLFVFDGAGFVEMDHFGEVVETGPDGSLWSSGAGLVRYDGLEWREFQTPSFNTFDVLTVESGGAVWLSPVAPLVELGFEPPTEEEVVWFDGATFVAYQIRHVATGATADSGVWLGVQEQMPWEMGTHDPPPLLGLYWFADDTWYRITSEHGLADDEVSSVAAAPDGSIWVATPGGVNRIVPGTEPIGFAIDVPFRLLEPVELTPTTVAPPVADLRTAFFDAFAQLELPADEPAPTEADVRSLYATNSADLRNVTGLSTGEPVPVIDGELLDGGTLEPTELFDGTTPVLVLYWATTEPMLDPGREVSALSNLYAFQEAYERWGDELRFVSVIAAEVTETGSTACRGCIMDVHGFTFPTVFDPSLAPVSSIELLPMWMLLDGDGGLVDGFFAFGPVRLEGTPLERLPVDLLLEELDLGE